MGRSKVTAVRQPDENTCGPSSLKVALAILGKRRSLASLTTLCRTNGNGTSTKHMIRAVQKLGLHIMVLENATLTHIQSALKRTPSLLRASMVSYLYGESGESAPSPESGHWAVIRAYQADRSRIVLLDSYSGSTKSYAWTDFMSRWKDYDRKRKIKNSDGTVRHVRIWQHRMLYVIARSREDLPTFKDARYYEPA